MSAIQNMKFAVKLGLLIAIFILGFLIFGAVALVGLDRVQVNGPVYQDIVNGKDLIADVLPPPGYIIETHLTSLQMLISLENGTQAAELPTLIEKAQQLSKDFEARHIYWDKILADGDLRTEMITNTYEPGVKYFAAMEGQFIPAIQAGKLAQAKQILNDTLTPLYLEHRQAVDQVNLLAAAANSKLETTTSREIQYLWIALIVVAVVVIGGGVPLAVTISAGIVKPIRQMVSTAELISKGNVNQTVELHSKDEIGQLAEAFRNMIAYLEYIAGTARKIADQDLSQNVSPFSAQDTLGHAFREMSVNLRGIVGEVKGGVDTLASSSSLLTDKAQSVAHSAETMSMNSTSAAAGMEEAATNLRSIAAATEEMTATINEIARTSEKARHITSSAVEQAESISSAMRGLGDSANDIGIITETITAISKQTNLLALNATIEAARAGENGRGFAVVAAEIKALALQTSAATEDIKGKISSVQDSTGTVLKQVLDIIDVFSEVSTFVTSIATAIEEQSVVTRDIAENISQATQGVLESNKRVGETAVIVQTVAQDIAGSNRHAYANKGKNVLESAEELSQLAAQLRGLVARFSM